MGHFIWQKFNDGRLSWGMICRVGKRDTRHCFQHKNKMNELKKKKESQGEHCLHSPNTPISMWLSKEKNT